MASLDMSLDDMIKSRRTSERGRGRGRARRGRGSGGPIGGGRTTGPPRRGPLGVNARPSAFTIAKSLRRPKNLPWQRDLFEESLKAAGLPGLENGTKLFVSNLDVGVTNEDIRELFSEIGELSRYALHFDKSGRPSGSAEVLFARRSDAFQALKRYNNVKLDGKPMKIEILGPKPDVPVSARVNVVGGVNGRRTVVMTSGAGRGRPEPAFGQRNRGGMRSARGGMRSARGGMRSARGGTMRGGGRGGRGRGGSGGAGRGRGGGVRGRGRGRNNGIDKSADQLDKELESYHAENMQS